MLTHRQGNSDQHANLQTLYVTFSCFPFIFYVYTFYLCLFLFVYSVCCMRTADCTQWLCAVSSYTIVSPTVQVLEVVCLGTGPHEIANNWIKKRKGWNGISTTAGVVLECDQRGDFQRTNNVRKEKTVKPLTHKGIGHCLPSRYGISFGNKSYYRHPWYDTS